MESYLLLDATDPAVPVVVLVAAWMICSGFCAIFQPPAPEPSTHITSPTLDVAGKVKVTSEAESVICFVLFRRLPETANPTTGDTGSEEVVTDEVKDLFRNPKGVVVEFGMFLIKIKKGGKLGS